jgi:protein-disulfide isomerase
VLGRNPKTVRVVFKQFPLKMHTMALPAAKASLAAHQQGKFWEMHDQIFKLPGNKLSDETLRKAAETIGLNMKAYDEAVKSPKVAAQVDQDMKDGLEAGVRGTPALFINGRLMQGADRTPDGIQKLIDDILKRAGK